MDSSENAPADFVKLTSEPNLMRAHLVSGRLEDEGIPTIVGDDHLMDEWAMSQKLMGNLPYDISVPEDRLEEARAIFLAMSQPIPHVDEDDPELEAYAEELSAKRSTALFWIVGVVFVFPVIVYIILSAITGGTYGFGGS